MKKLVSLILTMGMVMTLGITAFAEDTMTATGDTSIDVQAKYQDNTSSNTVYSVDVSWGAMQFTYAEEGSRIWDPSDHSYSDDITAGWTASGNTVTVTNHSNAVVTASFAFSALDAYDTIVGSFDTVSQELDAGIEGSYGSAESVTAALTLSGTLAKTVTDFTKVGTITVTIQ